MCVFKETVYFIKCFAVIRDEAQHTQEYCWGLGGEGAKGAG